MKHDSSVPLNVVATQDNDIVNAVPAQDNDIINFVTTQDNDIGADGEEALQMIVERIS